MRSLLPRTWPDRQTVITTATHHRAPPPHSRSSAMFDYLSIMLQARLARKNQRGASAVEYGLLIAGIAALIVVIVYAFGGVVSNTYKSTCTVVGASANAGTC